MTITIHLPHPFRKLKKSADKIAKFIGDYLYYRRRNHSRVMAWRMARNTL